MFSEKLLRNVTIKLIFLLLIIIAFFFLLFLIYLTFKWLFVQTVEACVLFADQYNFAKLLSWKL